MKQLLIILLLGMPLMTRLFLYYDSRSVYKDGDTFNSSYRFMQEPRKNAFSQHFFVDDVFITIPLYPKFYYGDYVFISGIIEKQRIEKGELLILKNPMIKKVEDFNPVISITKFVRSQIEGAVVATIPQKEAGLLLGIILGVRDKIDEDFYDKLQRTGVLHVVAASGQNVSILAGLVLISLQKIVKRDKAIIFTGGLVIFYSLLSGFDPPIVRASLMAFITFGAMLLGKQTSGFIALFVTGWVMVFFDPSLIENVSFQLSFLATFGIISLKPLLDKIIKSKFVTFLKEDVNTTLSAQIATLPVILSVFGTYSLISLPVNVMILWTVPLIMLFGITAAFLSILSPFLSVPLLLLSYPLLLYFTTIIELLDGFGQTINIESFPILSVVGYYLILFAIVIFVERRGGRKI